MKFKIENTKEEQSKSCLEENQYQWRQFMFAMVMLIFFIYSAVDGETVFFKQNLEFNQELGYGTLFSYAFVLFLFVSLFFYDWYTKRITCVLYNYVQRTQNKVDNLLDNHCLLGLTRSSLLVLGFAISSVGICFQVYLSIFVAFIFLFLWLMIDVFKVYNQKQDNTYAHRSISYVFCSLEKDDACKNDAKFDEEKKKEVKPILALVASLKTLLIVIFFIVATAIWYMDEILRLLPNIGIGAGVLGFVFQPQLNALISSAKLFFRDGFHIGDWIEVPELAIDGEIESVTSLSVVISNWDKTKTNIPFEIFINHSYTNWSKLKDENVRRIKRSILIDSSSVRTFDRSDEYIQKIQEDVYNLKLISSDIQDKLIEIEEHNNKGPFERQLTNIGLFRIYIYKYLEALRGSDKEKRFPMISNQKEEGDNGVDIYKYNIIVRQLSPNEFGIPIEIYAFANTYEWEPYENIQSDIFDHLFVMANRFGLKLVNVDFV